MEESEIVEQAKEYISDGLEEFVDVPKGLTSKQLALAAASVVAGTAIGAFVGYRFAEKRLSTKFEQLMAEESEQLREHYAQKLKAKQEKPSMDEMADLAGLRRQQDAYSDIVADYQPTAEEVIENIKEDVAAKAEVAPVEMEAETSNIFVERDKVEVEPWDYSKEMKARDPRFPYIIHVQEWEENASEYDKIDLTYYEGDEVLSNDNDVALGDIDETVGYDNLKRFGHGSGDPHTLFIRNDVREVLYEVSLSGGTYAQEVGGFDPELSHSYERRTDRRRFDDD